MLNPQTAQLLPPRVTPVNVYEEARKAPLWEQVFYTVWLFGIFMPIDALQPVRYACMAGLLGMFALHWKETGPLAMRAWPIFLIPVFAAFSIFWTPYPAEAPRSVILLLLTPVFLITLVARLRAVEFLRLTMIAGWLGLLYALPFFGTFSEGGPYGGKNSLAFHMMIVILLSLGTFLREKENIILRFTALAVVPVAFYIQYLANSATSLVFALVGSFLLIMVKLIWSGASQVRHLRSTLLTFFVALSIAAGITLASASDNAIVDRFLNAVGKDSTFTGRTAIWEAAERVSNENPMFGVGIEGFWNPLTGTAQTLNENDSKPFGTKLSFHSAFWEVRVHFGFVGLAMFIFALVWTGWRTIGLWLRDGSIVNSTLLVMFVVNLVSCFTESYVVGTSSMMVYFLYFGALAAFGIGERKFVGVARLIEREV